VTILTAVQRWFILSFVAAVLASCSASEEGFNSRSFRAQCPDRSSEDFYFPAVSGTRGDTGSLSRYLAALGEPSLSCGQNPESYRLIDAGERIRVVRVDSGKGGANLRFVQGTLSLDVDVVRSVRRQDRALAATEWHSLESSIAASGFWTEPGDGPGELTMDHIEVIEGRRGNRYRVLRRVGLGPDSNNIPALKAAFLEVAGAESSK